MGKSPADDHKKGESTQHDYVTNEESEHDVGKCRC